MVELHAAIVDVDVGAADSLGIDWQAARRTGNWQIAGGSWASNFKFRKFKP